MADSCPLYSPNWNARGCYGRGPGEQRVATADHREITVLGLAILA